jgi:nucleotide-binding universal stress UspA family protein
MSATRSACRRPGRAVWLAGLLLLAGCRSPSAPAATGVVDLDGRPQQPLAVPAGAVHVLVFVSQECPIANSYAPTLQRLAQQAGAAVRWFVVHVDPELSAAAAREHAAAYDLPGTVLRDPRHQLARQLGIHRTPEAAVLGSDGLRYRGRIDDQWPALGSRRPAPTQCDLEAAIERATSGQATPEPWPPAVGCRLPEPAAEQP